MKARTAAWVGVGVALVFAALAVAGVFNSGPNADRKAAERYIGQVNALQHRHNHQLASARIVLQRFAAGKSRKSDQARLEAAAAGLGVAARETAALDPPKAVEKLGADIVSFYSQERASLVEVAAMLAYPHRVAPALRAAGRADSVFHQSLRRAKGSDAQRAALGEYARAVRSSRARFLSVEPPPLFAPWHRSQVAHLDAALRFAGSAADAIAAKDAAAVTASLNAYRSALDDRVGLSRAQRRAVITYNRRLNELAALAGRIQSDEIAAAAALR